MTRKKLTRGSSGADSAEFAGSLCQSTTEELTEQSVRAAMRLDLAAIWAAARRRWAWVLTLTSLASGAVAGWRLSRKPTYSATAVVRVSETRLDPESPPMGDVELASYIGEAFLTRTLLSSLIARYGLYPEQRGKQRDLAIERMLQDIDIEVAQNYFAPERYLRDNPLRTARLVISYDGPDAERALLVVRELGATLQARRSGFRRQSARAKARARAMLAAALRERLAAAERARALLAHGDQAPLGQGLVGLAELSARIAELGQDLKEQGRAADDSSLQDSLEELDLGMRFEVIDPGRLTAVPMPRPLDAALFGAMALAVALPLSIGGVGGLHRRVCHGADVERLGLRSLGTIALTRGSVSRT